jgi:pimeloyl-ACP methyl ester carboxylesterase
MPYARTAVARPATTGFVALAALLALACFPAPSGAAPEKNRVAWLCKPGKERNPCQRGLETTLISPSGDQLGVKKPHAPKHRKVDCFYVYPTVSDQQTPNANLHIDPEERSIALYQAARYSQYCRVYAPMYRQITLQGILDPDSITPRMWRLAYTSALRAWKQYLRKYNDGRGVVLIGHSQGTYVLRKLIAREIDPKRELRRKLVSALLLGGDVTVADGSSTGGDFEHVRACHSRSQLHCVIAFSTFNAPVPDDARFGRAAEPGLEVLCTNPAELGGKGGLRTIYPSKPFAPNTSIGAATRLVGVPEVDADTPWIQASSAYFGSCSSANDANVLQIAARDGAPDLRPVPNAAWGLHLTDANIALGNLITVVRHQAKEFVGE